MTNAYSICVPTFKEKYMKRWYLKLCTTENKEIFYKLILKLTEVVVLIMSR